MFSITGLNIYRLKFLTILITKSFTRKTCVVNKYNA